LLQSDSCKLASREKGGLYLLEVAVGRCCIVFQKNLNLLHGYLKPKQILAESVFKTVKSAGRTIAFFIKRFILIAHARIQLVHRPRGQKQS